MTPEERKQAEEIIESILESLGDPINIHNHAFEIRPYTVDHKTEWWIFHKEVASGEPLAQWLDKFAALHAQQKSEIAQRCPVCGGNGLVPNGFYNTVTGIGSTTSIVPETCRTCNGTGVILPSYLHAQKIADKMKMVDDMLFQLLQGNLIDLEMYLEYTSILKSEIKMPTEEEIEEAAYSYACCAPIVGQSRMGFRAGIEWLRNQITEKK